ncbi:hypothetical protein OCK02_11875 [Rhizobium sp. TRM96647]|uniref:hypothetical protein n=1 Tax=unclassified Rhizobium TaxID=2613769 RepID=UPI001E2AD2ED|nr:MULTISPECIES: hypothetical protein [unclassified Rhizobium]MCD2181856.1 hypothetical protein [Rhizobium sp. GN54]MCV3736907.1 hypothetical protein [Rhizobium sp. TRM96647]MCV3756693.1 hypothetical protein [Rhizobium sp. TRM96650]
MMNFLPDLHEGHAPITLQHLFRDAIDTFYDWKTDEPEPSVMHEGTLIPISTVFEAMRGCTDIVPKSVMEMVAERLTKRWDGDGPLDVMTFSTAARIMGVLIRKRRRQEGEAQAVFVEASRLTPPSLH